MDSNLPMKMERNNDKIDLIIDDTPGMVVISSFNVVRKQIARLTIEKLISDGRIHPAKIEEFHDKAKHEMELNLR